MEYWGKENQGYSEYTNGTPNLRITPGDTVAEQLSFLKKYYETYKNASGKVKGLAAKNLRDEIRNKTKFNLEGLFYSVDGSEFFMNEPLRDFLNTSDEGDEYNILNIVTDRSWNSIFFLGTLEHQTKGTCILKWNKKFVHSDGREVIIDYLGNIISFGIIKGTFNYGLPSAKPDSEHNRFDMEPFFRQYHKFPVYRVYISDFNLYNKNGGREEISWMF